MRCGSAGLDWAVRRPMDLMPPPLSHAVTADCQIPPPLLLFAFHSETFFFCAIAFDRLFVLKKLSRRICAFCLRGLIGLFRGFNFFLLFFFKKLAGGRVFTFIKKNNESFLIDYLRLSNLPVHLTYISLLA